MPQPAENIPRPKGRVLTGSGAVVTIIGAVPTVLGALVWASAAASNDPNAGWAIFIVLALEAIGVPVLLTGLVMVFFGKTRKRRSDLVNGVPTANGGVEEAKESLVVPILGILFSVLWLLGLALSLYSYFGNKPGSRARRLGLVGVVLSLGVALVATFLP